MSKGRRAVIVGPGRVGKTLRLLLQSLDYKIEMVSRSREFAPPDLLLITTPDSAIAEVARELARKRSDWQQTVALHCSGAFGSELLAPLKECGASVGSLHPLKSFARPARSIEELKGIYWCIEGDTVAERVARRIVRSAVGKIVRVKAEMKPVYHAAAVMASGHMVALIDLSLGMLEECGIGRRQALDMLMPLVESTVQNLPAGTLTALTGPFARRDSKTVDHHLEALMKLKEDYLSVYLLLGRHSLRIKTTKTQRHKER
jgi:predicted short-subunit dehydrogenase-like oxidoreductase (DUF2520 family)